jgi:hypothetical protein
MSPAREPRRVHTATFSRATREHLARRPVDRLCCRISLLSGLVRQAGTFLIRGGDREEERYRMVLSSGIQPAARLLYSHFKAFGPGVELRTSREPRFGRRLVYEVHVPGLPGHLQALNELGVLSDSFRLEPRVPPRLVRSRCCRNAFLRGCFVGRGSVNDPQRPAHLEILTPYEEFAEDLSHILEGMGFHPGVYLRRDAHVVYLKGGEEVAELLALMGAHDAALALEEGAVLKEVRSRANRVTNCDEANVRRANKAAQCQLEAIEYLQTKGILAHLPPALVEMAELRSLFPELDLEELAAEGPEGLSRSAVNHRLRRLVAAARDAGLRQGLW